MMAWGWWLVATCILLVAEMLTFTFILTCLAAACLASAITSLAGCSLAWQLLAFALAASLCFFWLWRHRQGNIFGQRPNVMNVDRVLGAHGLLIEAIDPASNTGRVRLPFEQWKAASEDGLPLAPGTRVEVVRRDGTTLFVRPLAPPSTSSSLPSHTSNPGYKEH